MNPAVRLSPALGLLALVACDTVAATEPSEPLAATYVLTRVDGAGEPLVIADHLFPSGERQVYTLTYDSIRFGSDTAGTREFQLRIETRDGPQAPPPPLDTRFAFITSVTRRGNRVVLHYATSTGTPLNPDTFTVRGSDLVRTGTYGVVCGECPPLRRVEYLYEPR